MYDKLKLYHTLEFLYFSYMKPLITLIVLMVNRLLLI